MTPDGKVEREEYLARRSRFIAHSPYDLSGETMKVAGTRKGQAVSTDRQLLVERQ
jgi:hypothetical protein